MIWIPAGSFTIGNTSGVEDNWSAAETAHKVTLTKGFWMSKYETTQEQWESVMKSNASKHQGNDLPVENVSWNDVFAFVKKVRQTDPKFNLPTEAQWEYAAKAGSEQAYSRDRDSITWHKENSGGMTHPVGTKECNAWGLYDIHGNVGEWVLDWKEPFDNTHKTDPAGPALGEHKIIKGGQHTGRPRHTMSWDRQPSAPDTRTFYIGFRLIREA